MNLSDFDYHLPQSFIAQEPLEPRDSSKLMRLGRSTGVIAHSTFRDIVDLLLEITTLRLFVDWPS